MKPGNIAGNACGSNKVRPDSRVAEPHRVSQTKIDLEKTIQSLGSQEWTYAQSKAGLQLTQVLAAVELMQACDQKPTFKKHSAWPTDTYLHTRAVSQGAPSHSGRNSSNTAEVQTYLCSCSCLRRKSVAARKLRARSRWTASFAAASARRSAVSIAKRFLLAARALAAILCIRACSASARRTRSARRASAASRSACHCRRRSAAALRTASQLWLLTRQHQVCRGATRICRLTVSLAITPNVCGCHRVMKSKWPVLAT